MMVAFQEEDQRSPRCLFNGGPHENVEDLIEVYTHVLGARKLGHVVLWQESPLLESKPSPPEVVHAPKPPAGMAAFAQSLSKPSTFSFGTPAKAKPTTEESASVSKKSKSHEKRKRKKERTVAAASAPEADASPTSPDRSASPTAIARAADENRMI